MSRNVKVEGSVRLQKDDEKFGDPLSLGDLRKLLRNPSKGEGGTEFRGGEHWLTMSKARDRSAGERNLVG